MKNREKTKIGLINFTNCLPINYSLEQYKPCDTEFIYGTPAELNRLMSENKIDVAPISSYEYLRYKNLYTLIKSACISSDGECGSVILFSNADINSLNHCKIGVPIDSASSIALLKIILNEFGNETVNINFMEHKYEHTPQKYLNSGFDAVLFIGDNALKENTANKNQVLRYDIGKLWKQVTGYPAVFGTWAARTAWVNENQDEFLRINNLIIKAIETGLGVYFNEILNEASAGLKLDRQIIREYLGQKIQYKFTGKHEKSLDIFKKLNKLYNEKNCIL